MEKTTMSLVPRRWMTPPEAALICEEDPQCGGFTYKVTQGANLEM